MNRIVIIGGGFAGVWAAAGAARLRETQKVEPSQLSITLLNPQRDMAIRPRLYERHPEQMRVSLPRILGPIDVHYLQAAAEHIDTEAQRVTARTASGDEIELGYDRLALTAGSRLRRAPIAGAEHLHNVDTLAAAVALDQHLRDLPERDASAGRFTAVVIGSGFTGLEVATELTDRMRETAARAGAAEQARVVLIERAEVVGPELGAGPRPVIEHALETLGIDRLHGTTVQRVDPEGVKLANDEHISAQTVIWSAGMLASPLTEQIPAERDQLGRLAVSRTLQVNGQDAIFAAGDTAAAIAEEGRLTMQSCQHAHAMGRIAGHNLAAGLLGQRMVQFVPDPYVTCLDLGGAGAVFTTGWGRRIRVIGQEAKEIKRKINRAIYPPVDDRARILDAADYRAATRTPTPTREASAQRAA